MTQRYQVKIVEVGPRDGLQSETETLPVSERVEFINLLSDAGLPAIEVGSFVSPKWIPQLADSDKVYQEIHKKKDVDYSLLVPNEKGYEMAIENKVESIAIFTAASELFCQKNINRSIDESLATFASFIPDAKSKGIRIRGYVSCAIACPYEGYIPPTCVHEVARHLFEMGCDEISLGDTMGVGTPRHVKTLLKDFPVPLEKVAVHFHDTYGQAIANIYTALELGITIIDSSVSGLGGCPFAKGASGNVATEDVIYFLNGEGIKTNVDLLKLLEASAFIDAQLQRETTSKASQAMREAIK